MDYDKIFTNKEFVERAKLAESKKTLYVMGCFGAPLNAKNKARYKNNNTYNKDPKRQAMIDAASDDTFGFDCSCLVKGLSWGWNADPTKNYGGANYCSNGVKDLTIKAMMEQSETSTDFSNIEAGEVVALKGYNHVGIYIGDGLVIESTPSWDNKVQVTRLANTNNASAEYKNRPARKWDLHGKLPWIEYVKENHTVTIEFATSKDAEDAKKGLALLGFKVR